MAKKKKKKKRQQPAKLSPQKYIMTRAGGLPIWECYINENWEEVSIAVITVARQQPSGNIVAALYLVDVCCLGLKDTSTFFNMLEEDYKENVLEGNYERMNLSPITCSLDFAKSVIYGGIAYAKELGFKPHKDFGLTQYVLGKREIDKEEYIEFGKDGKPHYFAGPHDNIDKVIAILNRTVGEGNYHLTMPEMEEDNFF